MWTVRLYVNVEPVKSSEQNEVLSTMAEIGLEGEVHTTSTSMYGSAKGDREGSGRRSRDPGSNRMILGLLAQFP